jgi:hypothetical protein
VWVEEGESGVKEREGQQEKKKKSQRRRVCERDEVEMRGRGGKERSVAELVDG